LQEHSNQTTVEHDHNAHSQHWRITDEKITEMKDGTRVWLDQNLRSHSRKVTNEIVTEMKDQVIRAKAYLSFTPPGSNSHFVKELKQRIREVERAVGQATKDSNLSRRYKNPLILFPCLYLSNMFDTENEYGMGI
jgi:alpha-1,4-galacturonosyltransferase